MTVSLCVLAKYPAHGLWVLYGSARRFVDEIVIRVDQGADEGIVTDEMMACSRTKVLFGPAISSVRDTRNEILAQCSGEWVLHLDCDENLTWWLWSNLRSEVAARDSFDLIMVPKLNACADDHGQALPYSWEPFPNYVPVLHRRRGVSLDGCAWHYSPVGHASHTHFPPKYAYSIIHTKTAAQVVESDRVFHAMTDGWVPPEYDVCHPNP